MSSKVFLKPGQFGHRLSVLMLLVMLTELTWISHVVEDKIITKNAHCHSILEFYLKVLIISLYP